MLAIVAPGQGAQTPGFLSPWLADQDAKEALDSYSQAAQLDLTHFGTEADAETIRDTAIAQPLLVASALMAARPLLADFDLTQTIVAGHSVGELAALAIAGVITDLDAIKLVTERGAAMAEASAARPTSMTAVLAGDRAEVEEAIAAAGLTAANNNGTGQLVAAGTIEQLTQFATNPPRRARLVPLSVAGAFHTVHMQPAVDRLRRSTEGIDPQDPNALLLTNSDGHIVRSGIEAIDLLVRQVAHPVRWDLCMETMVAQGITGLIELNPAGTLSKIAQRNLKGVELCTLNEPGQLPEAREFVAKHIAAKN